MPKTATHTHTISSSNGNGQRQTVQQLREIPANLISRSLPLSPHRVRSSESGLSAHRISLSQCSYPRPLGGAEYEIVDLVLPAFAFAVASLPHAEENPQREKRRSCILSESSDSVVSSVCAFVRSFGARTHTCLGKAPFFFFSLSSSLPPPGVRSEGGRGRESWLCVLLEYGESRFFFFFFWWRGLAWRRLRDVT